MDYKALGLIAGIEIHQQLDTAEKLFCHCPTALRETAEHSGEFCRYLRATVSEMGEIDRAAQEEMKHDRLFHYYTYDTTCLVENDEEPPAPVNDEALAICLTIGKMFGMTPVPQVQERAYASALVLTVIVLALSLGARSLTHRLSRHIIR